MALPVMDGRLVLVVALENAYEVSIGTFDGDDLFLCHRISR